jgi:hypothetical protein
VPSLYQAALPADELYGQRARFVQVAFPIRVIGQDFHAASLAGVGTEFKISGGRRNLEPFAITPFASLIKRKLRPQNLLLFDSPKFPRNHFETQPKPLFAGREIVRRPTPHIISAIDQ